MKRHIGILAFGLMVAAGVTFAQIGPSTPGLASSSLAASVATGSKTVTAQIHTASFSTSAKHSISGSSEDD
jgi:hypothetical protein